MDFIDVCLGCMETKPLVKEWERLTGLKLVSPRAPVQKMIDDACGFKPDEKATLEFMKFVFECVWIPLVGNPVDVHTVNENERNAQGGEL